MGSIISGIGSYIGGQQAASYDKSASDWAKSAYYQTRSDLLPYTQAGYNVLGDLTSLAKSGPTGGGPDYVTQAYQNLPASSGAMTQAELEQTPGYQFTLGQGLQATQSAAAAKGLGISGAALKGAAKYATGLADSTYANRFNEAKQSFTDYLNLNQQQQENLKNQYTRLSGVATLGENAGAATGTAATEAAKTSSNALISAGNAEASGTKGLATGIGNTVNDLTGYGLLKSSGTGGYSSG